MMKITRDLIFEGQSKNGGWSRKQVEELGISWPLKSGWITRAIGREVSEEQARRFVAMKDEHIEPSVERDLYENARSHMRSILEG